MTTVDSIAVCYVAVACLIPTIALVQWATYEGLDGGGGSGIHNSLKIWPIIHLIKILGYTLKQDQLFIKSKKNGKEI